MKYKLYSKKEKDGYYHFYIGNEDVTDIWMDFFSGLTMEEEKDCGKLFCKNVYICRRKNCKSKGSWHLKGYHSLGK